MLKISVEKLGNLFCLGSGFPVINGAKDLH